ncbi:Fic/DOC family protein [Xanthomonas oryzae pv. oryzicola]|uniref:Fic/DOC family protein n=1 Tax=Xanthomonas oryzae TaxID=347 RepID=UPI0009E74789|nr:Fic family protein [Xanthomonas oryzae]
MLEAAEAAFAATAVQNSTPIRNAFEDLLDEVCDCAGMLRTVDIAKGTTRFCISSRIDAEATRVLSQLDAADLTRLPRSAQMRLVAEIYGELNMVHPFREGNGRTQRLFFEHWLLLNGLAVSWKHVSAGAWIAGCIAAVSCNYAQLEDIFDSCIMQIEEPSADQDYD